MNSNFNRFSYNVCNDDNLHGNSYVFHLFWTPTINVYLCRHWWNEPLSNGFGSLIISVMQMTHRNKNVNVVNNTYIACVFFSFLSNKPIWHLFQSLFFVVVIMPKWKHFKLCDRCWFVTDHYIGMLIWFLNFVRNRKERKNIERPSEWKKKNNNDIVLECDSPQTDLSSYRTMFTSSWVEVKIERIICKASISWHISNLFTANKMPEIAVYWFIHSMNSDSHHLSRCSVFCFFFCTQRIRWNSTGFRGFSFVQIKSFL